MTGGIKGWVEKATGRHEQTTRETKLVLPALLSY